MGQNTKLILLKIATKQKEAPFNWKELIATKMRVKPDTVSAYALGKRGLKKDKHIEVLTLLHQIIADHKKNTQKLTA